MNGMKVLFVCSGNAHRSPLAEALLKMLRPDVEVDSAGLRIAIPISEEVREYLARENAEQYLKKKTEKTDFPSNQTFEKVRNRKLILSES